MKLEIKNISKQYGKKTVLQGVSQEFSGGVYGLLGPNGAGKTTLLNIIATVLKASAGTICYEQKNVFDTALADTLEKDCSYDVVQSVHEQLRGRIQEHKESRDPAPLELTVGDVGGILSESGVSEEKVESFRRECEKQYGENAALNPKNILGTGKFEITTPEVKITIAPENSYLIEARMIGGRRYLLIPADDGVEVNGVSVSIPNEEHD